MVRLHRSHFRPQLGECLHVMSLGMSSSLNQVALCIVQIVINNSLTYYGELSIYGKEIPLAAVGIVMKTNAILLAIIIGISQGSQPIIGFNYGAQNYTRVRGIYKLAIGCALAVSAVGWPCFSSARPRSSRSLAAAATSTMSLPSGSCGPSCLWFW